VGAILAAPAADAKSKHKYSVGNVAGAWYCAVEYNSNYVPPNPWSEFSSMLMFDRHGNVELIANTDDNGLVAIPELGDLANFKTSAYGRWEPTGRRSVAFSAVFFETYGLSGEELAGLPKNTTKLGCEVKVGHYRLSGACTANVYAPNGDPIDGTPTAVLFPDEPLFTADCKRLSAK